MGSYVLSVHVLVQRWGVLSPGAEGWLHHSVLPSGVCYDTTNHKWVPAKIRIQSGSEWNCYLQVSFCLASPLHAMQLIVYKASSFNGGLDWIRNSHRIDCNQGIKSPESSTLVTIDHQLTLKPDGHGGEKLFPSISVGNLRLGWSYRQVIGSSNQSSFFPELQCMWDFVEIYTLKKQVCWIEADRFIRHTGGKTDDTTRTSSP